MSEQSKDIVQRLRDYAEYHAKIQSGWGDPYDPKNGIFWAAADLIEALEAEVESLKFEKSRIWTQELAGEAEGFKSRAEAAEAQASRMRDALEKIAAKDGNVICLTAPKRTITIDGIPCTETVCDRAEIARKALENSNE